MTEADVAIQNLEGLMPSKNYDSQSENPRDDLNNNVQDGDA